MARPACLFLLTGLYVLFLSGTCQASVKPSAKKDTDLDVDSQYIATNTNATDNGTPTKMNFDAKRDFNRTVTKQEGFQDEYVKVKSDDMIYPSFELTNSRIPPLGEENEMHDLNVDIIPQLHSRNRQFRYDNVGDGTHDKEVIPTGKGHNLEIDNYVNVDLKHGQQWRKDQTDTDRKQGKMEDGLGMNDYDRRLKHDRVLQELDNSRADPYGKVYKKYDVNLSRLPEPRWTITNQHKYGTSENTSNKSQTSSKGKNIKEELTRRSFEHENRRENDGQTLDLLNVSFIPDSKPQLKNSRLSIGAGKYTNDKPRAQKGTSVRSTQDEAAAKSEQQWNNIQPDYVEHSGDNNLKEWNVKNDTVNLDVKHQKGWIDVQPIYLTDRERNDKSMEQSVGDGESSQDQNLHSLENAESDGLDTVMLGEDGDIKDNIDMGLNPEHRWQDMHPSYSTGQNNKSRSEMWKGEEIKGDIDLGLRPEENENIERSFDVEKNFKDNFDSQMYKDNEIKKNIEIGLRPEYNAENLTTSFDIDKNNLDDFKSQMWKENDMKNDIDMGLKPDHDTGSIHPGSPSLNMDKNVKSGEQSPIWTEYDVKDNIDLGLKQENHGGNSQPGYDTEMLHKEMDTDNFRKTDHRGTNVHPNMDKNTDDGIDLDLKHTMPKTANDVKDSIDFDMRHAMQPTTNPPSFNFNHLGLDNHDITQTPTWVGKNIKDNRISSSLRPNIQPTNIHPRFGRLTNKFNDRNNPMMPNAPFLVGKNVNENNMNMKPRSERHPINSHPELGTGMHTYENIGLGLNRQRFASRKPVWMGRNAKDHNMILNQRPYPNHINVQPGIGTVKHANRIKELGVNNHWPGAYNSRQENNMRDSLAAGLKSRLQGPPAYSNPIADQIYFGKDDARSLHAQREPFNRMVNLKQKPLRLCLPGSECYRQNSGENKSSRIPGRIPFSLNRAHVPIIGTSQNSVNPILRILPANHGAKSLGHSLDKGALPINGAKVPIGRDPNHVKPLFEQGPIRSPHTISGIPSFDNGASVNRERITIGLGRKPGNPSLVHSLHAGEGRPGIRNGLIPVNAAVGNGAFPVNVARVPVMRPDSQSEKENPFLEPPSRRLEHVNEAIHHENRVRVPIGITQTKTLGNPLLGILPFSPRVFAASRRSGHDKRIHLHANRPQVPIKQSNHRHYANSLLMPTPKHRVHNVITNERPRGPIYPNRKQILFGHSNSIRKPANLLRVPASKHYVFVANKNPGLDDNNIQRSLHANRAQLSNPFGLGQTPENVLLGLLPKHRGDSSNRRHETPNVLNGGLLPYVNPIHNIPILGHETALNPSNLFLGLVPKPRHVFGRIGGRHDHVGVGARLQQSPISAEKLIEEVKQVALQLEYGEDENDETACDRYDADGCSVPFGDFSPYNGVFTQSCNRHDICYSCGAKYHISRQTCDAAFKDDMMGACVARYGQLGGAAASYKHREMVMGLFSHLRDRFDSIIFEEMHPVMNLSRDSVIDKMLFQNHVNAARVQVVTQLVKVLAHEAESYGGIDRVYRVGELSKIKYYEGLYRRRKKSSTKEHNSWLQKTCQEIMFLLNTKTSQSKRFIEVTCEEIELLDCYAYDVLNYLAVRIFGDVVYHRNEKEYCGRAFVRGCLPPLDPNYY